PRALLGAGSRTLMEQRDRDRWIVKLTELAARSGEDVSTLRELIDLGILVEADDFGPADVERVRLVGLLRRRGVEPEAISAALDRRLDIFDRYLGQLYPDDDYPSVTLKDAAARAGVDLGLARRVQEAGGL